MDFASRPAVRPREAALSQLVVSLGRCRYAVDLLSSPAPGKGQDAHVVTNDFIGVADGATPLVGMHADAGSDPGVFAAEILGRLSQGVGRPLPVLLRAAIEAGRASRAEPRHGEVAPSCTVACLRSAGDRIEAAVLGDCEVIVAAGASVRTVSDARLRRLDGRAVAALRAHLRMGADPATARRMIQPLLREHRSSMNRPDTYWAVAGDPEAARHLRRGWFRPERITAILVASDGFMRITDTFREYQTRSSLLRAARDQGLAELGARLRSLEHAAGSMRRYPRFSEEDDVTAVLLEPVAP